MPAKDRIHANVKNALIKDGWDITHDPYIIQYGDGRLYADLAAERTIAAERQHQKIVVEVKSFIGYSVMQDFKQALGQYLMYLALLERTAPEYQLYIAVSDIAYEYDLSSDAIELVLDTHSVSLLVVDIAQETITQWIR